MIETSQRIAYFARTTRGVEELVRRDIAASAGAENAVCGDRTVEFSASAAPDDLLKVRSVDDIFVEVGRLGGIERARSSLQSIKEQVQAMDFDGPLGVCAKVRQVPESAFFSVTASFIGRRNYNRWEMAEQVREVLCSRYSWKYLDPKNGSLAPHDVHVRLHLEGTRGLLGIRLGANPSYKRSYKTENLKGSLTPPLAYLMARLAVLPLNVPELPASPEGRKVVLDPFCGVGTIPIEAAAMECLLDALGGDIDERACRAAAENANAANVSPLIFRLDSLCMPLKAGSVDAIASDLPWGKQTTMKAVFGSNVHVRLLREFLRVLKPGGRMALLTEHAADVEAAAEALQIRIENRYALSLFGRHPVLFVACGGDVGMGVA